MESITNTFFFILYGDDFVVANKALPEKLIAALITAFSYSAIKLENFKIPACEIPNRNAKIEIKKLPVKKSYII